MLYTPAQLFLRASCKLVFLSTAAVIGSLFVRNINAQSQTASASLSGTVFDASGSAVPNAKITLTDADRGIIRTFTTPTDGSYSFTLLAAGQYSLVVEKQGFQRLKAELSLNVGQSAGQDLRLTVGEVNQEISVSVESATINAENANVGSDVTNKQVVELPLNLRNVFGLVYLDSSVNNSAQKQVLNPGGVLSDFDDQDVAFFNFGGARFGTTAFLADGTWDAGGDWGGSAYVPGVDETEEFKIQTNSFTAQYGWSMGNAVNLVTKSGTNSFHGDAFEFLRNDKLDANNFFNNVAGIPRPAFHQNQYGVTAGGPLYIPKLYRQRNKTFIFGSFQGRRQSNPATLTTTVPTDAMKQGDFSAFLGSVVGTDALGRPVRAGQIYNPYTTRRITAGQSDPSTGLIARSTGFIRDPIAGNLVAASLINPVSANLLQYWPEPTGLGTAENFAKAAPATAYEDAYTIRVDHNFTDNTRFFVRWSQKRQFLTLGAPYFGENNPAGPENGVPDNRWQGVTNLSHVFSPTLTASATFGWTRWVEQRAPQGGGFLPSTIGLPSFVDEVAPNFPSISMDGIFGLGGASNGGGSVQKYPRDTQTTALDVTKVHGGHTMTAGWMFVNLQMKSEVGSQVNFNFPTSFTSDPDQSTLQAQTGIGFASFLVGTPNTGGVTLNAALASQKQFWGWYFQDDWKLTPRLTLNLGLRYDFQTAPTDRFNQQAYFDYTATNPISSQIGFNVPGEYVYSGGSNGRGLYNPQYNNFAPRVGFAYRMTDRLLARGGFAMFYIPSYQLSGPSPGFTQNTPFVGSFDGFTPAGNYANPFPNGLIQPAGNSAGGLTNVGFSVDGVERFRPTPYVAQWTVGLSYQLTNQDSIEATYIGNHGVKLLTSGWNRDTLPVQDMSLGNALLAEVPNPFYGKITSSSCGLDQPTIVRGQLLLPFPEFCSVNDNQAPDAYSFYQAATFAYKRRFSHGLQVLASFTVSKYLDNSAGPQGWASGGNSESFQYNYNLAAEKSLDANDIPKSLVVSWVYEIPVGKGRRFGAQFNKTVDAILGGWQLTGVGTFKDGFPLSLSTLNNTTGSFGSAQRPNIIGDPTPANQSIDAWINAAAFAQPAPFTFGNTSRTLGYLRAPGMQNLDLGIHKFWQPIEQLRVQFRMEMFNSLNHANLYAPSGCPGQCYEIPGQFGTITSALPARDIQMALKLLW